MIGIIYITIKRAFSQREKGTRVKESHSDTLFINNLNTYFKLENLFMNPHPRPFSQREKGI